MQEDEDDEEELLRQAMLLSMEPNQEANGADQGAKTDLKDIVDTDLMKGIINDLNLGIDLDPSVMEDILGALDKKDEEEPKKPDEDKKD